MNVIFPLYESAKRFYQGFFSILSFAIPLFVQDYGMKKNAFLGIVLSAWIFGIFSISNFPTISKGKVTDNQACLTEDASPEIYLRNSITTKSLSSEPDYKFGGLDFVFEFSPLVTSLHSENLQLIFQTTSSLFDTTVLFQRFFETW